MTCTVVLSTFIFQGRRYIVPGTYYILQQLCHVSCAIGWCVIVHYLSYIRFTILSKLYKKLVHIYIHVRVHTYMYLLFTCILFFLRLGPASLRCSRIVPIPIACWSHVLIPRCFLSRCFLNFFERFQCATFFLVTFPEMSMLA